jgi:hypothetical protein
MPTTRKKRVTPATVIEEVVGEDLAEAYVAQRNPMSGELQDRPLLVVLVEREETCNLKTDIQAEIENQTGWYFPVRVYVADEKDNLVLPDEEVVPI